MKTMYCVQYNIKGNNTNTRTFSNFHSLLITSYFALQGSKNTVILGNVLSIFKVCLPAV